jgi:hypothetical protein
MRRIGLAVLLTLGPTIPPTLLLRADAVIE